MNMTTGMMDAGGSIYGYHGDFLNGWNTTRDTTDPIPLDFVSLIQNFLDAPDGAPGCLETCTRTNPPGNAS
jgi:hypothetical protein